MVKMVSRFLEQEDAIRSVLSADRKAAHLIPTWQDLEVLTTIDLCRGVCDNVSHLTHVAAHWHKAATGRHHRQAAYEEYKETNQAGPQQSLHWLQTVSLGDRGPQGSHFLRPSLQKQLRQRDWHWGWDWKMKVSTSVVNWVNCSLSLQKQSLQPHVLSLAHLLPRSKALAQSLRMVMNKSPFCLLSSKWKQSWMPTWALLNWTQRKILCCGERPKLLDTQSWASSWRNISQFVPLALLRASI